MTRRVLTAAALALALFGAASCGGSGTTRADRTPAPAQSSDGATGYLPSVTRPNILVIEADDMRVDELKFMPNVRNLIGARGLTFENSFAPYPLCCPSRASFLSGKYAHNHHVLSHVDPFGFQAFDDHLTLATQLKGDGYQTALVGKYLNGYAQQPTFRTKRSSLHYVPPGWDQWYAGSDHNFPAGSPYRGSTYNYFSMTQDINGRVATNHGKYSTDVLARQTRALLGSFGAAKKPWFIWWTPVAPHFGGPPEPDDPPRLARADGVVQKFETPARPNWVKGRFDSVITHALGTPKFGPAEADMSDKPRYLRTVPEMLPAEKDALTQVTRQRAESIYVLDRQVGRTIAKLRATGQYKNTIIAFTSDNGYFLGEHRKRQGKILPHEPSLRVPFLIAGPGIRHGKRYDPVTTIDMAPTFASYAGLKGMPEADGISLLPNIENGDRGWTRPVLTEGFLTGGFPKRTNQPGFHTALNERGIRTARYKYVKYATGEVELYDLKTDPLELESRQNDPAYDSVRRKLDALWTQYINCRQATCAKPMPSGLRSTVQQERAITLDETRRTRAYYDDYPLH